MYVIMGWLGVLAFMVMTSPFWLRFINDRTLHLKGGTYGKALKLSRKIHKPLGVGFVAFSLVHGRLALGSFRLHTGTLLWLSLFITAGLGILYYSQKKKDLFVWHRRMALVVLFLLLIHLIFPMALYYLL
ncbi:MAG: hypothetical protein EOM59_02915 [Clostridia bacterium]|nr:hypothetical protein [Clostridia bacterium]